jgi:hypothetical protein
MVSDHITYVFVDLSDNSAGIMRAPIPGKEADANSNEGR